MIASIKGTILSRQPTQVVVEVSGVGFEVGISVSTYDFLGEPGSAAFLFTYLHVREDALQLYGFRDETERRLFLALISISGIGPRLAMGILSGADTATFCSLVRQGDVGRLKKIPGVGPKTAERVILEMKGKIDKIAAASEPHLAAAAKPKPFEEAILALVSLGYREQDAQSALDRVAQDAGTGLSTEEAIRQALKQLMQD